MEVEISTPDLAEDDKIFDIEVAEDDRVGEKKIAIPFLSDHAIIWFNIDELEIVSWNLENRCRYKTLKNMYNNPFNIEESPQEYENRLEKQIDKIITILTTKKIDVFFLQEVGFLKTDRLMNEFKQKLSSHKYKILYQVSPKIRNYRCTVYNMERLKFLKALYKGNGINTELFLDKVSNKKVRLGNMHLLPPENLLSTLQKLNNNKNLTIIGGTCNAKSLKGFLSLNLNQDATHISLPHTKKYQLRKVDMFYLSIPSGQNINAVEKPTYRFYKDSPTSISMKPCNKVQYNNITKKNSNFIQNFFQTKSPNLNAEILKNLNFKEISFHIQKILGHEDRQIFANHKKIRAEIVIYRADQNDLFFNIAKNYIKETKEFDKQGNTGFVHSFTYKNFLKLLDVFEYPYQQANSRSEAS